MAGFDDQTQIRGQGAGIRGPGSLLVGVRWRKVVRKFPWAGEHFTSVVGAILILDFLGHDPRLVSGMRDTDKIAPGNSI